MSKSAPDLVIDLITEAMSVMADSDTMINPLAAEAHQHLRDARKLLIAKYQPNVYPHGMD